MADTFETGPLDPAQPEISFRDFDDVDAERENIYNSAIKALSEREPLQNATHRLELADIGYDSPAEFSIAKEKEAILKRRSLYRPLKATLRLSDLNGNVVEEKRMTVANVPHLTSRGTVIRNGIPYVIRNQARLRPGAYTRKKKNGGVETHFNVKPGTGRGFRVELEPESGLFKMRIDQSTTRLYPVLKSLGISDDEMKEAWGEELFNRNFRAESGKDELDLDKVAKKLGRPDLDIPPEQLPQVIRDIINRTEIDEETSELTLGERIKTLSPQILLRATKKQLDVANDRAESDNRDSQAYQSFHSAEDLVSERLKKDQIKALRTALWKAAREGSLRTVQPGLLDKNIDALFNGSGLTLQPEDNNPLDIYDLRQGVTRLGEGGIASQQSVSRDARGIQASYIGVIAPERAPESSNMGLDLRVAAGAKRGSDNKLYATVKNIRTGQLETVSARDLASKVVTFPGELSTTDKRVPAIKNDNIVYVNKDEVDYEVPSANGMFSKASLLIPQFEGVKSGRLLMGARMSVSGDTAVLIRRLDGTAYYGPIEGYVFTPGDKSLSINKKTCQLEWMDIVGFIPHKNVKKMYRVELASGRYVDATADHSFVTIGDDGYLRKMYTQDMVPGTAIPIAGVIPAVGKEFTDNWVVNGGNKHNSHNGAEFKLDFQLGWIHGMYLSEGYGCGNDRNGEKTYVTFANCDLDVLDRVAKFFCDIGIGCKPMSGRADGKLDRVRVYWKQLYEKLKEDFGDGAYNKRIPGWVFFAPEEFRKGLLAGYIAGDGGVQRRRDRVRINGSSRSKELIVGLGNLCTSLGITTTQDEREVNTGPGGTVATQHYFEVRSEHTSLVPALGCERKDAIIRAAAPWSGKKSADWMPIYASLKQQIVGLSSRRSTARHKIYVDQHTKQSVREALGETAASVPWLNSGVKWDKVKSIRQLDESDYEYVYDIDMGDNVFMCANGIFVHNTQQAVPLIEPEAPFVQTADDNGASLHSSMSKFLGARHAPADGIVTRVTPDFIEISTKEGKKVVDLYNNYHTGRKSFMHNEALVQPGQSVAAGQLLASSNYTDKSGVMSVGRNLRTAYMTAEGDTIEDAYVISESAAKKLGAQAMYKSELDTKNLLSTKKDDYVAIYADKFNQEQYNKLDDSGIIRIGETVKSGDPLILGVGKKTQSMVGAVMNTPKASHSDLSQTWDHKADGVVTDVVNTKDGIRVYVKSLDNVDHADKICMRYGNKGVVVVRPDSQMPVDEEGNTIDVLVNTNGVIGRINPSTLAEQLLGKVAAKTGKPYVVKAFGTPDVAEFALNEAAKHGIKELETVTDPRDGRKIPGIFVGNGYVMRLTHKAEGKMSARDSGSYTTSGYPAKGGFEGSKRISLMDNSVLLAAGATNFLKDAKLVRGQRNDDYWRAIRNGEEPVLPEGAIADQEFLDMLTSAGVHVQRDGTKEKLRPLLDRDVDTIAKHEITNSKTFDFESMEPIQDGLFDIGKTGGADGNMYAKITLPEKIPHPLFIDPIQKLLGITNKTLMAVLSGQEQLNGKTGPEAIESALKGVDINRDMEACKIAIRTGKQLQKDAAVKKLNYLAGLKKMEVKPEELMVSKIPVIPPKYRPIITGTNTDMVHDFNYLYHDLLEAKQNYLDAKNEIGSTSEEYLTLLKAVRAITGAEDPVNKEHAEQGIKGILRYAIGLGDSPKFSNYQRRVIGQSVDQVGRGVITADGTLKMDEIGVPFEMAWNIYKPYIIRRLVQAGKPASEAVLAVQNRAEDAKKALLEEVKVRPVAYNRAPALHQYAYFAAWPKLTDDHAIRVPYTSYAGLGADNDGDAINIHVPSTREAIKDLEDKLMPSKRLFSSGNFQAHMLPMQDYIAGMYLASQMNTNEPVKTFQTVQDAKRAYARGEISARTPIRILQG